MDSKKGLLESFIKYPILSNIIIAITLVGGVVSILNTKKSFFPETKPRVISIQVAYPGASPEEMEEGVTLKIEEAIRSIVGLDEITSTSSENFASIRVTTLKGYDLDEIYTEIKNSIDGISSFPLGAERPVIFKQKPRTVAMWLGLSGDVNLKTLKKLGEEIEDELKATDLISQVSVQGFPQMEIAIEVSEENLLRYGLTFDMVSSIVRSNNRDISGGAIKSSSEEFLIRSRAKDSDIDKIGEIVLRSNPDGTKLLLRDIAVIKEQFGETPDSWTLNKKEAVFLRIDKLAEEDLQQISDYVKTYVAEYNKRNPSAQLAVSFDFYKYLKQRLQMLFENGGMGLILVLISLGFFLSLRLSAWVAFGIPLSFLGMFIIASFVGITINMISLFGMILVIGILVDDGIVIAENIYTHFEKGKSPYQAALDGTKEVLPAVMTSVTTTIIAFTPLLLLEGGFEFLFEMAVVIIGSLAFSLIEAFLVLPAHLGSPHTLRVKKKVKNAKSFRDKIEDIVNFMRYNIYGKMLSFTMKNKYISLAFLLGIFPIIFGLIGGGFIKSTFFPAIPFTGFSIDITFKAGTREDITKSHLVRFENQIWELNEELKSQYNDTADFITTTFTGLGSTDNGSEQGGHAGTVQIFHRELDGNPIDAFKLADLVREKIGDIPEAEKLTVGGMSRFGKPVSVRLLGKDFDQLDSSKVYLKKQLALISELKEIQDNISVGRRELDLTLNSQAYFLGFTNSEVIRQIRQGFFGEEVQRLQKGRDEIRVWVRYPKEGRSSLEQLENTRIRNQNAQYPLSQLATYEIKRGISGVKHYDGVRTVTVEADMKDPFGEVPPIIEKIEKQIIPELLAKYPGVKVDMGGQSQESARAGKEIGTYFGMAFFIIFIIIIFAFKSFYQAILVMIMIPLGWIGAAIGHGIQGIPISILSAWGMIALSGVIINDAVVFLDKFNRNMKEGMSVQDAAYNAGIARFRAIILTSITTVLGLFPLILEKSFQAQFLIPMAVSIAYGVLIGTFIILLFFPVWIVVFNDVRRWAKWLWTGTQPSPESVERVIIDAKKEHILN